MASDPITLLNLANDSQVYNLTGIKNSGAAYKMANQELATPRTLDFDFKIGAPGSLGNDTVVVTLRDSRQNADTGQVKTLSAKLILSIPRDAAITNAIVVDEICQMASLLSDANAAVLADAMVP